MKKTLLILAVLIGFSASSQEVCHTFFTVSDSTFSIKYYVDSVKHIKKTDYTDYAGTDLDTINLYLTVAESMGIDMVDCNAQYMFECHGCEPRMIHNQTTESTYLYEVPYQSMPLMSAYQKQIFEANKRIHKKKL